MAVIRTTWLLIGIAVGVLTILAAEAVAQRPGGPGRGQRGGSGGPFGGGGPVELLQRPDVQAELEMLEDQKQAARALAEKFAARRRELFGQFAGRGRGEELNEEQREAIRQQMRETFQQLNQEIEQGLDFLLPHQRKRLSQLEIQWRIRGGGGALAALANRELAESLQITEQQRDQLREKGQQLGRELRQKIAALQREMQEQLLAELNDDQREKFQNLLGDPFDFQDAGGFRRGGDGGRRPERPAAEQSPRN